MAKKLLESAKNWKSGLMLHYDEILALILNKCIVIFFKFFSKLNNLVVSIQLKCQMSSENKFELEELQKKEYFREFSKNYEDNIVNEFFFYKNYIFFQLKKED